MTTKTKPTDLTQLLADAGITGTLEVEGSRSVVRRPDGHTVACERHDGQPMTPALLGSFLRLVARAQAGQDPA